MRPRQIRSSVFFFLLPAFVCPVLAQYDASTPGPAPLHTPLGAAQQQLLIRAKVELEDGAALVNSALQIVTLDSACRVAEQFGDGTVLFRSTYDQRPGSMTPPCYVRILLPGYQNFAGYVQNGSVVVLRRLGEHEGSSVSVTTLQAPPEAQKLYSKGEALMAKKKWAEAQSYFEKCVEIYPGYATAWSELGQADAEQEQFDHAKSAFQKAIAADPKYLKPLVQMAAIDGKQEQWQQELDDAQRAISMHPIAYPSVYYYAAEAEFHLGQMTEARKQCQTAIESDLGNEVPQARFLMGLILTQIGERASAIDEFKTYEKIARRGPLVDEAKKHVAELSQ